MKTVHVCAFKQNNGCIKHVHTFMCAHFYYTNFITIVCIVVWMLCGKKVYVFYSIMCVHTCMYVHTHRVQNLISLDILELRILSIGGLLRRIVLEFGDCSCYNRLKALNLPSLVYRNIIGKSL